MREGRSDKNHIFQNYREVLQKSQISLIFALLSHQATHYIHWSVWYIHVGFCSSQKHFHTHCHTKILWSRPFRGKSSHLISKVRLQEPYKIPPCHRRSLEDLPSSQFCPLPTIPSRLCGAHILPKAFSITSMVTMCILSREIGSLPFVSIKIIKGLPQWASGKESTFQCRGRRFHPWSGELGSHMPRGS